VISDDPSIRNLQQAVLSLLQSFVDDLPAVVRGGSGLFLYGPVGTGKDHLLAAAMLEAVAHGFAVAWTNGLDIFANARDAISEDTGEAKIFERLTVPTVLAISDPVPPVGDVTAFQRSLLLRVIDHRYRSGKATWVTMNVADRAEAERRLGVQLIDRLTDGALCLVCNWPSFRLTRRWTPSETKGTHDD
jgi:DNA replication protein DnaC